MSSKTIDARVNAYNTVEIHDPSIGQLSPVEFKEILGKHLDQWRGEGRKGVYLDLGISAAKLVPVAVELGFNYHHAHDTYLMMTCWLDKDAPNSLPPGPCHFIGVAGFVVRPIGAPNSKSLKDYEVLVVREKHGPSITLKDFWKLPGGLVDRIEDLAKAAPREVLEETGIDTTFDKIACIYERHDNGYAMTRKQSTDLYTICTCKVKPGASMDIKIQESEISAAQWMNLDEFLNSSIYKNMRGVWGKLMRTAAEVAIGIRGGIESQTVKEQRQLHPLYLAAKL